MNKKYNLFLDDIRNLVDCTTYRTKYMPQSRAMYTVEDWVIVRSYKDFVETIQNKFYAGEWPEKISFDHDLAEIHYEPHTWSESYEYSEETGNDCAKWLVQFCIDNDLEMPETWVHSMNPIGAERIKNTLEDWYKYVEKFKKA